MYNVSKNFFCEALLLLEANHSVYFHRAHTLFNCMFECVYCFEKILLKAITSAWSPLLNVLSQSAYFVQLYVWMCITFQKISSARHCFCLKPTTQCNFTECILCSISCLNVYNVSKKFFWKPFLLLEAHHSLYFHRAHTLFNCMFEGVYCFEKILLKAITSAWSPLLNVLSQNAYFVQFHVWMCIMFQKNSSESHSFSLKPTTHCTFTERILCSIVCLNVYIVLKKFFWRPLLLLEAHHSLYFHRAHTLFNCMFECVYCFEKLLLKPIASAWSPPLSVLSQNAYYVQFHVWMCIKFQKNSSESHSFSLKPTTHCTFTERILCSNVCLNVYIVLKKFFWRPLLVLEAHCSMYFHRALTFFNCMFECV